MCNGQLLPISQNTALFSLLGTYYGGDGKSTFALPNLEGSAPVHAGWGAGPGLTERFLGEQSGTQFITLIQTEIPVHSHFIQANTLDDADSTVPGPDVVLGSPADEPPYYTGTPGSMVPMNFQALSVAGASMPHNNMMPYVTFNFCIAMQGVFPPRP